MEKKIKPHTMQTFQAVYASVIYLLVEVGAQKSCGSSVGWVSDTRGNPGGGTVLWDAELCWWIWETDNERSSLFKEWLLKCIARR